MATELIIRIFYPLQTGKLILKNSLNWDEIIEPTNTNGEGNRFDFHIISDDIFFYFKPCIVLPNELIWSKGENYLALMDSIQDQKDVYPHFFEDTFGSLSSIFEISSNIMDEDRKYRIYFPAGYSENILKRYPVLYMHDGANLFSSDEAFLNREWQIDETMNLLDSMNLIDKVIVVGIYSNDRMREYTNDRNQIYGRFLVEELKIHIDNNFRTLPESKTTATMGSSLGGVISLFLGWQFPEVFGKVACLSSTFGFQDNLSQRIMNESKKNIQIYIDSAWKNDNYEVNRHLQNVLSLAGYKFGDDLLYFTFPDAEHNEISWGLRCHLPFQFFFCKH